MGDAAVSDRQTSRARSAKVSLGLLLASVSVLVTACGGDGPTPYATSDRATCDGATAICNDNTCSFSENRSGACSGHGGVRAFLKAASVSMKAPESVPVSLYDFVSSKGPASAHVSLATPAGATSIEVSQPTIEFFGVAAGDLALAQWASSSGASGPLPIGELFTIRVALVGGDNRVIVLGKDAQGLMSTLQLSITCLSP